MSDIVERLRDGRRYEPNHWRVMEESADEITRLRAELITRQSELEVMSAELAACRKDALRYRWLCINNANWTWNPSQFNKSILSGFSAFDTNYAGYNFESAIDSAIAAMAQEGGE